MHDPKVVVAAAAGEIVTFGVTPDHPATGYGYIHSGEPLSIDPQVRRVARFVEKPARSAPKASSRAAIMWNSGNFVFRADVMLEELGRFDPEVAAAASQAVALAGNDLSFIVLDREFFVKSPKISIDYAAIERTHRAAVLAFNVGCRPVVDRLAVEPTGRRRQQSPWPGRGDQFDECVGAFG